MVGAGSRGLILPSSMSGKVTMGDCADLRGLQHVVCVDCVLEVVEESSLGSQGCSGSVAGLFDERVDAEQSGITVWVDSARDDIGRTIQHHRRIAICAVPGLPGLDLGDD